MDIEKYLDRISYKGERKPVPEVLNALQKTHLMNVPFENLDIHYHYPIILNVDRFFDKIVLRKRGGFCYELNGLFHMLLLEIGFDAKIISARVHNKENNYSAEYDHLAILVKIGEKEYLSDVGFGEFAFEPLELALDKIQHDQRGDFIIEKHEENYYKVSKVENLQRIPEYIFTLDARHLKDFEGMCCYHQTNPESHFKQKKLITIPTENGRITISGNHLKIVENGNIKQEEILDDASFKSNLEKYFNIAIDNK